MMRIWEYTYSFDPINGSSDPINGSSDPIKGEFDLINQIAGKEDEV